MGRSVQRRAAWTYHATSPPGTRQRQRPSRVSEFDYIPIETSEGHRPPSPATDRLLIGLASVALMGGLLIAAGNLVGPDDDGLSVASGSPAATARPSRTPRPSPSPRPRIVFTVEPGTPTPATPPPPSFSGWIRATTDLVVRTRAAPDAPEAGVLATGAVAFAEAWPGEAPAEGGWLHVMAPAPQGWIATSGETADLVERYQQGPTPSSAYVWELLAGAEGFVAMAMPPVTSDPYPAPVLLFSADGTRWRTASTAILGGWRGWGGVTVAWGPAGWLAVNAVESPEGSVTWVWQSPDGLRWSPLGTMAALTADSYPTHLVASDLGYLLSTENRSRGGTASLWSSRDGITWHESADPAIGRQAWVQVAATPMGFYAWDQADEPGRTQTAAFSLDGRTWSAVESGPGGPALQVTSLADQIIGIDVDPDSGAARVWLGTVARDRVAWLRDPDAEEAFVGARPTELVSDGQRVVAFGWELSSDEPLVWSFNGQRWSRSALPSEFRGGIPRLAAAGPSGFVLLGYRPTLRGANPIFWHRTNRGTWLPEGTPVFEAVPDASGEECASPPIDALGYNVLDRPMAVACFGMAPITFRAWAARCEGCYWDVEGREPAWLMGQTDEQLFLSPIASSDWGGSSAVIDPSLDYDTSWVERWLEVTGHFDDPAAASCTWTPGPAEMGFYEGSQATIDGCRQQFVVTAVTVVDGP